MYSGKRLGKSMNCKGVEILPTVLPTALWESVQGRRKKCLYPQWKKILVCMSNKEADRS